MHAAAAHLTSGFSRAAILVCDHEAPQVVVCLGDGATVTRLAWPSREPGPAALHADAAIALGFGGGGEGQHLEAFARLEAGCRLAEVDDLFAYTGDGIVATPGWMGRLAATGEGGTDRRARAASAVQTRLGDLLLALVADVRRATGATYLSLAGSLFYNTALCSRIKTAEGFEDVFVPVNPGNAGLAVGSALLAAEASPARVSAMLGPTFGAEEVKPVLDNCKLAYDWAGDAGCERRAVDALLAGKLVGWFDGPMESGPRVLGARSILANLVAFRAQNLNRFLKHRQPWRGYAVSCPEGAAADAFDGPRSAPHMECDYLPRDRERFRHVLPGPNAALRVEHRRGRRRRRASAASWRPLARRRACPCWSTRRSTPSRSRSSATRATPSACSTAAASICSCSIASPWRSESKRALEGARHDLRRVLGRSTRPPKKVASSRSRSL